MDAKSNDLIVTRVYMRRLIRHSRREIVLEVKNSSLSALRDTLSNQSRFANIQIVQFYNIPHPDRFKKYILN